MDIAEVLREVKAGNLDLKKAEMLLKKKTFEDLGFAKVDLLRKDLQKTSEVVYGEGKTAKEILDIVDVLVNENEKNILITRINEEKINYIKEKANYKDNIKYYKDASVAIINEEFKNTGNGKILIVAAGTSDRPVCEEAFYTAKSLGNDVEILYDVGVSGLHRLLSKLDIIFEARVIIAVAGMEGALASVIGGLVSVPVIAVPTSVGYGANLGGVATLLSMLNSCSVGVSVVNIDNGFGAAVLASRINHI